MVTDADHAAHQVDHQPGVVGLEGLERTQPAIGLVLGGLAHHAGVEHDHIGIFQPTGKLVAEAFKGRPQALRVGHVHLAAFGPNVVFFHNP